MQVIEEQKIASLSRELIKVTHKRRDLTQPTNYRPLCAMQSLYKVRVLKSLTSVVSEKLQSDRQHVHVQAGGSEIGACCSGSSRVHSGMPSFSMRCL